MQCLLNAPEFLNCRPWIIPGRKQFQYYNYGENISKDNARFDRCHSDHIRNPYFYFSSDFESTLNNKDKREKDIYVRDVRKKEG